MKKLAVYTFFVTLFLSFLMHSTGEIVAQTAWKPQTGTVKFVIKNAGFNVEGSFTGMEASVSFDPELPEKSSLSASVKSNTVNTSNSMRDRHLNKSDYFDTEKYPKITMKTTQIRKKSDGSFDADFEVEIKGVKKTFAVPFQFKKQDNKATFSGSFTLNRLDFGVGERSLVLGNDVKISLSLNVEKP